MARAVAWAFGLELRGRRCSSRGIVGGALVLAAVVLVVGIVAPVGVTAASAAAVTSSRLQGADRFETAANIAAAKFPAGVATVVLSSGLTYADALAGPIWPAWAASKARRGRRGSC